MGDQIFASLLTIDLSNIDAQVTFRAKIPMACFSLSFFIALDHCGLMVADRGNLVFFMYMC